MLAVQLTEASAKIRTGPPIDDDEDYGLPIWAGLLPLRTGYGAPIADPANPPGLDVPEHVQAMADADVPG